MFSSAVAFGQRVAVLHRASDVTAEVAARILLPGEGRSVRERARSARVRSEAIPADRPGRRRPGGRTILTPPGSGPRRIVLPGRPTPEQQVRSRCLDSDPAPVDLEVARRCAGFGDGSDLWRYESIFDQAYWRGRIAHLADIDPGSELLALLEERPSSMDEPLEIDPPDGVASVRARSRLDSMAARQALINALHGAQYADAADLALEYPGQQEFIGIEVAMALDITQAAAGTLLSNAFNLSTRLPGTLAALQAGRISEDVASVVVGATHVVQDPATLAEIESAVLPTAAGKSRESVRRHVCREIIRLDPRGADRRHQEARKLRTITKWADVDGMGWLKVHAPMEDIAAAWEALTGLADAAKGPGDDRTLGERRVDVFTDIFHGILDHGGFGDQLLPTQHGRRPHVGVLVPHDVLFGAGLAAEHDATAADGVPSAGPDRAAGTAVPPGVCELVGYGPIGPEQALRIAGHGVWRRIVYDPLSGTLLDYGTTRYEPPDSLKRFVITRDQVCSGIGCSQPAWRCQIDHALPFSQGGGTNESNLSPGCRHDHRAKDGGGWNLSINDDRSKTWTSPLGRKKTKPPHRFAGPRPVGSRPVGPPTPMRPTDPPPF